MALCAARKTNGEPCKAQAMHGMRVCRVHGGMTPRGLASPHYKTGRYSRSLPARLASRYEAARQDGDLLALREDVALLDARLEDLLARVDTGESGALWQRLMTARMELLEAQRTKDHLGQLAALRDILDLISQGHTDYRAWGEMASVLEQRRRLVESERRRLTETHQMITADKAMLLIGAIVGVIKEHVSERDTLSAISRGIEQLMTIDAE